MKKLILLLCLILLNGCYYKKVEEAVTLDIYIIDGCGYCDTFSQIVPDYLNKRFSSLTINYLDLDDELILNQYNELITHLKGFEEDDYKSTPLIVYENYFAITGYESGEEQYLYEDILHCLNNEKLGEELENYRFLFKEEGSEHGKMD